jgi:hypothetical protein
MGGHPGAINGTCFGSKEKWRRGEMGRRGGGEVAVPFHYGGGGMAVGRRAGWRELQPTGGGSLALS